MTELPEDLALLRSDLAAAKLPTPRARFLLVAAATAAVMAAAAVAATHYLGQPAPAHVKATFARLAAWQKTEPIDPATAKVLAFSPHTTLYGATTTSGGTCLELLGTGGFEYELFCDGPRNATTLLLYNVALVHGTAVHLPPVAVTGRLSRRGKTLDAITPDGRAERVKLGLAGFFSFEPRRQAAARRGDLTLIERDAVGTITSRERVPAQLVVNSHGAPVQRVDGVFTAAHGHFARFEVWADQSNKGQSRRCIGFCPAHAVAQTGTIYTAQIARNGTFTLTVPHQSYRTWWLTVQIVDSHFIPVNPGTDAVPVPDAAYWQRASVEAKP
jgi:hypothetical protein